MISLLFYGVPDMTFILSKITDHRSLLSSAVNSTVIYEDMSEGSESDCLRKYLK